MLPTFPYLAMTITGVLHLVFGLAIFITALVGFKINITHDLPKEFESAVIFRPEIKNYLGVVVGSSLWIMMVGILGILTGVKKHEHQKTHSLKIGYMVTAILSAVIFSLTGFALGLVMFNIEAPYIGAIGSTCCVADFVLSIVSSSICCCCAHTTVAGVVIVQGTNLPPPYVANVQAYPLPQVSGEGITNPGYLPNGPPVQYAVKNDIA